MALGAFGDLVVSVLGALVALGDFGDLLAFLGDLVASVLGALVVLGAFGDLVGSVLGALVALGALVVSVLGALVALGDLGDLLPFSPRIAIKYNCFDERWHSVTIDPKIYILSINTVS